MKRRTKLDYDRTNWAAPKPKKEEGAPVPAEHWAPNCYGTPPALRDPCYEYMPDAGEVFDPCPWRPIYDGLKVDWRKSNFVNPPYGRGLLLQWVNKAIEEWESGRADQVIWLVNCANSKAVSTIAKRATGTVQITDGRVSFIDPITEQPAESNRYDSVIYIWDRRSLAVRKQVAGVFDEVGEFFHKLKINN